MPLVRDQDVVRLHEKRHGKIEKYETNKIRILLGKIHGSAGYPVRFAQYIGYYSGIGMWIPDGWAIHAEYTTQAWKNDSGLPTSKEKSGYLIDLSKLTQNLEPIRKWREVYIYWVGQEVRNLIEAGVPLTLETFFTEAFAQEFTMKSHPIWENLGFYNTVNDILIHENWGKCTKELRKHGYY